jgi:1,4-alpha-glucan branching enzyme
VDCTDWEESVLCYLRLGNRPGDVVLVACNFTPVPRDAYRVGVPSGGTWTELLNGDATAYGGSGVGNLGQVKAEEVSYHGRPWSVRLNLPPLAIVILKPRRQE